MHFTIAGSAHLVRGCLVIHMRPTQVGFMKLKNRLCRLVESSGTPVRRKADVGGGGGGMGEGEGEGDGTVVHFRHFSNSYLSL